MDKLIYFESAGVIHPSQYNLINYPPDGYRFITAQKSFRRLHGKIVANPISHQAIVKGSRLLPTGLVKPYLNRFLRKNAEQSDMVYAFNQLVFNEIPWVVYVEWIHMPIGYHIRLLWKFRKILEKALASAYCKAILIWSEMQRRNILANVDCSRFKDKIHVVFPAVPKRDFVKHHGNDRVKLLFVGSGQNPGVGDFHSRGGKEVVKMFTLLDREYHNKIELVLRAKLPPELKSEIRRYRNIKLIENVVPRNALEQEFKSSDVLINPAHTHLNTIVIDAMSYGLPVIATDIYNYREWIEDGINGFLIEPPKGIPYFWRNFIPSGPSPARPVFDRGLKSLQWSTVKQLVEKMCILIEDEDLRKSMSIAARREVEEGRFSIQRRNTELKRIFDAALA